MKNLDLLLGRVLIALGGTASNSLEATGIRVATPAIDVLFHILLKKGKSERINQLCSELCVQVVSCGPGYTSRYVGTGTALSPAPK